MFLNLNEPGEPEANIYVADDRVRRCVEAVAMVNNPDARWVARVLNRYGHLAQHEADVGRAAA